jgi:hypothetical protein
MVSAVLANAVKSSPLYWGGELMETKKKERGRESLVAPLLGWRINGNFRKISIRY